MDGNIFPITLTFTITITQDLILKTSGIVGVLGLIGIGLHSIREHYKETYCRPSIITYRCTESKKE